MQTSVNTGCTINECKRRYAWNWMNNSYGGIKIAAARKNLGLDAFQYERLYVILVDSKRGLVKRLEALEEKFIAQFDSYNNGYNTSKGGKGNKGCALSATHKANISKGKSIPVILIEAATGSVINEKSLTSAAATLKVSVSTVFNHLHKLLDMPIKGYILQLTA